MAIRFNEDEVRPMGLVAAGVNAIKLGVGDEVVGAETLAGDAGEVLLVSSDGKAKRVAVKDFPSQGRYGRGVIGWDMPLGTKLAGIATGKPNSQITIHLLKAAAKAARLDEAGLKKRAATRGDLIVEVKPGDVVLGLIAAWSVERFISVKGEGAKREKKEEAEKKSESGKPEQLELLAPIKEKKTAGRGRTTGAKVAAAKTPASKKPAAKATSIKAPAAKTSATKKPAAKTPVAKKPAAKTPAVKKPAAKTPTKK
jgi:DNA gyrase/topoisomerase IV subunit A